MSNKTKNKHLKQVENQLQSGRSMVEMLGVLAIIAILSIGGIVGFRLAMNYYQANQIAHEMNIMRTDAQIKIAQGAEELMLGEPYDPISDSQLGHIQFNDDYPVDFACSLADDKDVILGVDCQVANAYYIELQNIPEGVCKPLSELVNGMSNIIAFNVNEKEYPDKGNCEAGNENVLNAVFSAEAVSELKACKGEGDCDESGSTPYCDPSRHVCVRCYEDNQCEHNQYCENNTCVTCESGVWNGEECVECTENDDCADISETPVCNRDTNKCVECLTYENCTDKTGTPQCDDESHTCKSCAEIDERTPVWGGTQCVECAESTDCEEALVCKENTCSPCETEEECQEKGTSYHCSNEDTCIQCGANEVWGGQDKGCVECMADDDCTDTPDTPKCNTATNQCVQCLADSDCNNPTPICSDKNTCVACKTNDECRLKNPSEENCTENGACCDDPLMTWNGSECMCPADYGISETTAGKKMCLPYCKEKEESGLIILIDQSGSMSNIVTEAGVTGGAKYDRAIEMLEEAVGKLTIPEEINAAVYLAGCANQSSDPTKGCYGSCDGLKITNSHLTWGKHSASEIQAALKIDELDKKTSRGQCSGVGYAIDEIIPLCKTGKEKFLIVIYWDNNDGVVNLRMDKLLQKCPQTKIYNVALSGKPYAGAAGNFNLNNINDLNNDINNALNEAIQQESCVQRPGG